MKVVAIRDAVHASDDPQPLKFDIGNDTSPEDVLRRAADRKWLPSVQGDRATWSIASNNLLAVVAYEWPDLKFLPYNIEKICAPGTGARVRCGSISTITLKLILISCIGCFGERGFAPDVGDNGGGMNHLRVRLSRYSCQRIPSFPSRKRRPALTTLGGIRSRSAASAL